MRLYLSARYSLKDTIKKAADLCRAKGHTVTATWMEEPHDGAVQLAEMTDSDLVSYAYRDLNEVTAADGMIFWSEPDTAFNRRGGRHVEFGYALRYIPIYVIGPRENIFHYVDGVQHFPTLDAVLEALDKKKD